MSRRPDNKAAQNQQTIKNLLKLEVNKTCADCKKNKHPRWASWNLGIFICIRCSGIHRGMGTHISRVKSVDLDAWTDEQLQNVMRWGNGRANKYWEAKLAAGHVPSDAKIENFIRTKYESKRWVMEGPMPDPSTLDDGGGGDDNVPLNVVREKVQLDRSASQRASTSSPPAAAPASRRQPPPSFNLIGDDEPSAPPPRPSTTDTPNSAARAVPPPKSSTPSQLLGGLDFFGGPNDRPSSAGNKAPSSSRPDLKQSILSLYASAPPQQVQSAQLPPQGLHDRQSSFGGLASPQTQPQPASAGFAGMGGMGGMGGMNDAFAGLSFSSAPSAPPAGRALQPSQPTAPSQAPVQQAPNYAAFANLSSMTSPKSPPAPAQMTSTPLSGGGFFDSAPKPPPKPVAPKSSAAPPLAVRKVSNASDGFGDFSSAMNAPAPAPAASTNPAASNSAGLLDFTKTPLDIKPPAITSAPSSSVFNLSKPTSPPAQVPASAGQMNYASKISTDPWGANEWASPDPAPAPKQTSAPSPNMGSGSNQFGWGSSSAAAAPQSDWGAPTITNNTSANAAGGWGGAADNAWSSAPAPPKVAAEEDFGGWGATVEATPAPAPPQTHANPQPPPQQQAKPFGGSDDLFSNVWD